MIKIAVFASGTGTNFDAILENINERKLSAKLALMVCDKPKALVVEKAKKAHVPSFVFNPKDYPDKAAYDAQAKKLAGMFSENFAKKYPNMPKNIAEAGPRA